MLLLLFSHPPTITPPVTSSNLGLSGLQGRKNASLAEQGAPIETFASSDRCFGCCWLPRVSWWAIDGVFPAACGCWVLNGIACSNNLAHWSWKRTRAAEGYVEEDVGDFSRKQHSQEWRHWRLTKSLAYISSVAIVKGAKRCGKVVISP